jgi:hypothetical protein
MAEIRLPAIEMSESLAILAQDSDDPVFRGVDRDGDDYLCGVCGSQILVQAAAEGDLYDLAFECHACGGLSIGPRLPAGRPLPWSRTVVVDPGKYRIGTIEGREGVVLAAREALDRALREVGGVATAIDSDGHTELDAGFLDSLSVRGKELLRDAYDELKESYDRGRKSKTPPRIPHRLMELLDAAEVAETTFRTGEPAIDAVATVELHVTLAQLARWSDHPVWPSLLPSLKSPQDFPHLVVTLAAASFLTDAGNGVELVPVAGQRSPDLRLHLGSRNVVSTEVKAPLALQRPQEPLDPTRATAIVRKALKSAGSGTRGQLSSNGDALLILGGFGLRDSDLDELEAAAAGVLRRHPEQRQHVLGIAFVSLGVLLDARQVGIGETVPTLGSILGARIVRNENYSGDNQLSQEQRPELKRVPEESLQEITLGPSESIHFAPAVGPIRRSAPEKLGRNDRCWCGSGKKFKRCHGR